MKFNQVYDNVVKYEYRNLIIDAKGREKLLDKLYVNTKEHDKLIDYFISKCFECQIEPDYAGIATILNTIKYFLPYMKLNTLKNDFFQQHYIKNKYVDAK